MTAFHCITFLTDYGLDDGFVASCHGVTARISPGTRIIDITHLIPPGDVRRGAAVLAQTAPYLPVGVHVAVVDPGVGTARRGIAIQAGERIFIGPDNGLLSWAVLGLPLGGPAPSAGPIRAYELTNSKLWVEPVSATFHGRDVFAPVAAHLANGLDIEAVGRPIQRDSLITLPPPMRRFRDGGAEGEVLTVDRFGNIQLSLTAADLEDLGVRTGEPITLTLGRRELSVPYRETFGSVPPGALVAYMDSTGCVALAVNAGHAAELLGLPSGARVRISPSTKK